jgi:CRP/FNR family cyclic AMP-dependent transcriptional regulator
MIVPMARPRRTPQETKLDRMRRLPFFADAAPQELEVVASFADELTVPEGKLLMKQGHPGHEFVVILEGEAVVERDGEVIRTIAAGDFAGEIALLTGHGRTATVKTSKPSRVLVIDENAFPRMLEQAPTLAVKLIRGFGQHVGRYLAS